MQSLLVQCTKNGDELSHNGLLHRANICSCKLASPNIFILIVGNWVADCCCPLQVLFFRLYVIDQNLLILTTSVTQFFVSQSAEVFPESPADKFEYEASSLLSWCEEFGLSIQLLRFVAKTIFCQFRSISHWYSHIPAGLMNLDGGRSTSSTPAFGRWPDTILSFMAGPKSFVIENRWTSSWTVKCQTAETSPVNVLTRSWRFWNYQNSIYCRIWLSPAFYEITTHSRVGFFLFPAKTCFCYTVLVDN